MAGLDPAIQTPQPGVWMPGSRPGMTVRVTKSKCWYKGIVAKQKGSKAMSLGVRCFFVATAVTLAGLIPASAEPRLTIAQAGSTGGTIGKQDKEASGGEVSEPTRARRAHAARRHHVAARAPRVRIRYVVVREPRPHGRKNSAAPGMALGGRWNFDAACASSPNWGGVATFVQTTASTFHGSFIGRWPAQNGIVTNGKIRGKHVSAVWRGGNIVHRFDANLVSMEPPMFKGYGAFPGVGACQYTWTKM